MVRVRFESSFTAMLSSLFTVMEANGDIIYVRLKEG
jgi:hypothetical protein